MKYMRNATPSCKQHIFNYLASPRFAFPTCFHTEYQMILEEAPHRISNPPASWLEDEVALKKRRDGFRKDYPTRRRGSVTSAFAQ